MFLNFCSTEKEVNPHVEEDCFIIILEEFNSTYFSDNWYIIVYDKLGDRCKVHFPFRLESKIRWSSVVYNSDGSVKPRVFTEIISVTLVKSRC